MPKHKKIEAADVLDVASEVIHAGEAISAAVEAAAPHDRKAATAHWFFKLFHGGLEVVRHFADDDEAETHKAKRKHKLAGHDLVRHGNALKTVIPVHGVEAQKEWRGVVKDLLVSGGYAVRDEDDDAADEEAARAAAESVVAAEVVE